MEEPGVRQLPLCRAPGSELTLGKSENGVGDRHAVGESEIHSKQK